MNFIYIHTHDSGREMQPYGIQANNPSLMKLAAESCLFRNAHCVAPTCSPSRAAMLTGMTAHNSGMYGLAHRGFYLNDYSQHLAPYLSCNGYYTALIGVQHEARTADLIGYDEHHADHIQKRKPARLSDEKSLAMALTFLREKPWGEKPFFLSFGLRSTHRNFPEIAHDGDPFVRPPYPIADTPETRHDWCQYLKSLEEADDCVGRLLDELNKQGLSEDTVIMFTTDHGVAFPQMKGTLYDTGTGVALMFRIPGKAPQCIDALVSHLDVYPTVCDLLGVPHPDWLQGKSMMPLLSGEVSEIHPYIFCETTYHATYEPSRSVRSKTAKLIRFYEDDTVIRHPNIDTSASKDCFLSTPLSHLPRRREMLFDLIADPCERINVIDLPEYAEVYAELSAQLDEHMKVTQDPLLHGPVAQQDGWVINLPQDPSPESPTYNNRGERAKAGPIPGMTVAAETASVK